MKNINKHTVSIVERTDVYSRFFNDLRTKQTSIPHEKQVELIKNYQKTGCIISRNKVVEANLLFCAKCAKAYVQKYVPTMSFGDLVSISTEGLIKAIDKFDTSTGYKLISYAVNWIKQYLGIYIQSKSRLIKQHSHAATVYKAIKAVKEEGLMPNAENVYAKITKGSKRKFSIETIQDVLLTMKVASLDKPKTGYDGENELSFIGSEELMPDAAFNNNDIHPKLLSCLRHLKPKEQDVLNMYFGLNGYTSSSFTDIAHRQGLTVEAVRQRYKIAIKRLRYYMKRGMQKKLF